MPPRAISEETEFRAVMCWHSMLDEVVVAAEAVWHDTIEFVAPTLRPAEAWVAQLTAEKAEAADIMEPLQQYFKAWTESFVTSTIAEPVLAVVADSDGEELVDCLSTHYANLARLAIHLGPMFAVDEANQKRAEQALRESFFSNAYTPVKAQFIRAVLNNVNRAREGLVISRRHAKKGITIIEAASATAASAYHAKPEDGPKVYTDDFLTPYLEAMVAHYEVRAAEMLSRDGSHYVYLDWVDWCKALEANLAIELLRIDAQAQVTKQLDELLLLPHLSSIVGHPDSGLVALHEDGKAEETRRMYAALSRLPKAAGLTEIARSLADVVSQHASDHLRGLGAEIIAQRSPQEIAAVGAAAIEGLLSLREGFAAFVRDALEDDDFIFSRGVLGGINKIVAPDVDDAAANGRPPDHLRQHELEAGRGAFPEMVTSYVDAKLRAVHSHDANASDASGCLRALADITSALGPKDHLQQLLTLRMGRRLLSLCVGRTPSKPDDTLLDDDTEQAFINALRNRIDHRFCKKMESMLRDIVSTPAATCGDGPGDAGFSALVLTTCHWPAYRTDPLIVPAALGDYIDRFTAKYKKDYPTRLLQWLHQFGVADLEIRFQKGKKQVIGSFVQAAILLYVDEQGQASIDNIAAELGIDARGVAMPWIATMLLGSNKLLQRVWNESGASLRPSDTVMLNRAFVHPKRRVRLAVPGAGSTSSQYGARPASAGGGGGGGGSAAPKQNEARRIADVEASIVRLLKSRQQLAFDALHAAICEILERSFQPTVELVRECVADLERRGFLKCATPEGGGGETIVDFVA